MPRYRIDLAYDGTEFRGYARQPDVRTVQGELEKGLVQVGGTAETVAAGRTDAGVHARGQVVSVEMERDVAALRLQNALSRMLPSDIGVIAVAEAAPTFNARFDALSRTYRYFILNAPGPDPFRRRTHWMMDDGLDVGAMNEGAKALLGEHDFASFCRRAEGGTTVRNLLSADWQWENSDVVRFEVRATAFCHQMVRSIVAVLVNVGIGRLEPVQVGEILEARDRRAGRGAAPPQGLFLWHVEY